MTETTPRLVPADAPPAAASAPGNGTNGTNGTVTNLVSGIVEDAQKLLRQQVEMLKAEVKEDFRRSKRAAEFGGLGIVLLTVGALGLVFALTYLLHEQYGYTRWVSFSIVGSIFFVAGAALAVTSYILLERFNPLPDKTMDALKENLSWKTA